jgi:hypothetical protein
MARRHLTFTLAFTLDEDVVRDHDIPQFPDGDSRYSETIDLLRTALHHQAALILAPYDAWLDNPEVECHGIDYLTTSSPDDTAF